MTEQEAKDKWCPFIQVAAGAGAMGWNSNRGPYGGGIVFVEFRCIGSACMAWRWAEGVTAGTGIARSAVGFCGLAGKP